uniref:Uncharacterized protein n=1 Tax=Lactuca sativa TaxID=4236 RepID=A0A9R1UVG2_LACSA|nr:hypothetical protein LSAT_V11C800434550 [Lactuca sativa]
MMECEKDYNLWKLLKTSETCLCWNESTRQLNCSDDWWDKKRKTRMLKKFEKKITFFRATRSMGSNIWGFGYEWCRLYGTIHGSKYPQCYASCYY